MMTDKRLGNLASILDNNTPRPRLVDPEATQTAEHTPTPDPRPASAPRRADQPSRTPPKQTGGGVRVTVRMDKQLRDQLAERAHQLRTTLAEVVFDAITAAQDQGHLEDVVKPRITAPAERVGAFIRQGARPGPEPAVTVELRMLASNRQALDDLAKKANAATRTDLIVGALHAYLGAD